MFRQAPRRPRPVSQFPPFSGTQPLPGTYSRLPEGVEQPDNASSRVTRNSTMYFAMLAT